MGAVVVHSARGLRGNPDRTRDSRMGTIYSYTYVDGNFGGGARCIQSDQKNWVDQKHHQSVYGWGGHFHGGEDHDVTNVIKETCSGQGFPKYITSGGGELNNN